VIYDTNDKNKDSVFPSFNIKWDMGSKKWDMGYSGCPTLIQRVSHFVTEVFPIPYQKQTNNMHMDVLVTNEISSI
jgi:hypothetical protein